MLERHKLLMGRTQDRAGQNNGSIGVFWRSFLMVLSAISVTCLGVPRLPTIMAIQACSNLSPNPLMTLDWAWDLAFEIENIYFSSSVQVLRPVTVQHM